MGVFYTEQRKGGETLARFIQNNTTAAHKICESE